MGFISSLLKWISGFLISLKIIAPTPTPVPTVFLELPSKFSQAISTPTPNATYNPAKSTPVRSPTPTKPPPTTSTSPTSTPTSNSPVCNYELIGPTGAIKINIKPQGGMVVGDQTVELHAQSGCKVLDGKSTDTQIMIARAGGNGYSSLNTVTYSTVPAGSYTARIQYKGQWTNYSSVNAVSGSSRDLDFYVSGSTPPTPTPTPTPTPLPKTTCSINVGSINSLTVQFIYSANIYSPTNKYMTGAQWDFDSNGSWDTDMSQSNGNISHTYPNAGTYNVRLHLQMSDGEITDACSTTITLQ